MKKAVSIVTLLLAASVAGADQATLAEVVSVSGLTEHVILEKVQGSLEALHFYEDDGRSCGLESFSYESARVECLNAEPARFVVETHVIAPVYECHGYRSYVCETTFAKSSAGWMIAETTCED